MVPLAFLFYSCSFLVWCRGDWSGRSSPRRLFLRRRNVDVSRRTARDSESRVHGEHSGLLEQVGFGALIGLAIGLAGGWLLGLARRER
jgi:hypothetical protein